jgi:hypothetical protein
MSRSKFAFEEGSVEEMARLRNQNDEFCRRLRAAIERGSESYPTSMEPSTKRRVSNDSRRG